MVGDGWQNNRIFKSSTFFLLANASFHRFFLYKTSGDAFFLEILDANKTSTSGDLISPFTFLGDQSTKRSGDETPSPKKKGKQFLWQQSSVQFSCCSVQPCWLPMEFSLLTKAPDGESTFFFLFGSI